MKSRGQLTPIESVISQDCQARDACAAQDVGILFQRSSLSCIVWYFNSSSTMSPSAWMGGCRAACAVVVSNQSARKLQQQSKIEVIAQEWTNWNRLLWNLQAFADTCWTQHSMSSLLPYYPSSQLPWQQLMGRENISQLFALLLLSFITWVNDMMDRRAS